MKIRAGVYQFTAVDDCSRFRVLGLYPRRASGFTLAFLERMIEEMPFPIQRVQTDRGTEFFAEPVQDWLRAHCPRNCVLSLIERGLMVCRSIASSDASDGAQIAEYRSPTIVRVTLGRL